MDPKEIFNLEKYFNFSPEFKSWRDSYLENYTKKLTRDSLLGKIRNLEVTNPTVIYSDTLKFDGDFNFQKFVELKNLLIPWRTGRYRIRDLDIESEWDSSNKFKRLNLDQNQIKDKIVADVGAGNGYLLYRLSEYNPSLLVGVDPNPLRALQFCLLSKFFNKNLVFEPTGIEYLNNYQNFFDVIFCMGVLYHRRDPVKALRNLRIALKNDGKLYFETIIDPDRSSSNNCLAPRFRYMKMRNTWFIPNRNTFILWTKRAGFKRITELSSWYVDSSEQRTTKDSPFDSLDTFIDTKNKDLTAEAYPVGERVIFEIDNY